MYHSGDHNLSSFDIDFPPTAQSTPVVNRAAGSRTLQQQPVSAAAAAASSSSLLTTPNNSAVEMSASSSAAAASQKGGRESPSRDGQKLSEAPRTPTPFKRALADVYQRREPLSRTVISRRTFLFLNCFYLFFC